jgi:hypothetical protein
MWTRASFKSRSALRLLLVTLLAVAAMPLSASLDLRASGGAAASMPASVTDAAPAADTGIGGLYRPLAVPQRIVDTRSRMGILQGRLPANMQRAFRVTGVAGVPEGALFVAMTVTAVNPSGAGTLQVYWGTTLYEEQTSVTFQAGVTAANLVLVAAPSDGLASVMNRSKGSVDVLVDVVGYVTAGSIHDSTGRLGGMVSMGRGRFDSRTVENPTIRTIAAGGTVSVPVAASFTRSTWFTVTVVPGNAGGFLTVSNVDEPDPATSTINFQPGLAVSNSVLSTTSIPGSVRITNHSAAPVSYVLDMQGQVNDGPMKFDGAIQTVHPERIIDTRNGTGGARRIPARTTVALQVAGRGGIPAAGAGAAIINVTVPATSRNAGHVVLSSTAGPMPQTSNLNLVPGRNVAAMAIVPIGPDGRIRVGNMSAGANEVVIDVLGYTLQDPAPSTARWSAQSRLPAGGTAVALDCPSANWCLAVTTDGQSTIWNGQSWSARTDVDRTAELSDVSCPAVNRCTATSRVDSSTLADRVSIYSFNGTSWTRGNELGTYGALKAAVSCTTAGWCAVSDNMGLWTGQNRAWTLTGPHQVRVLGMSCPAEHMCVATSDTGGIKQWDGTNWTGRTPDISGFTDVDCLSTTSCVAVSYRATALWDGTTWTMVAPAGYGNERISCRSSSDCFTVNSAGMTEQWNGRRWTAPTRRAVAFNDISCSATNCVAITHDNQSVVIS